MSWTHRGVSRTCRGVSRAHRGVSRAHRRVSRGRAHRRQRRLSPDWPPGDHWPRTGTPPLKPLNSGESSVCPDYI
eukprot:734044-Prymnesium_polylepis.1